MNILKNLFGGGSGGNNADDGGIYFYVRPRGCEEVVKVRIDPRNDLSQADDGSGYFVRKLARGTTYPCFREIEMMLHFDSNRNLTETEVQRGEMVDEEAYTTWLAAQEAKGNAPDETETTE